MSKKKNAVPPLTQWHTFAGDSYQWVARDDRTADRPADMRAFNLDPIENSRGKRIGWAVREWDSWGGGHVAARQFSTRNDALRYVRERVGDGGRSKAQTVPLLLERADMLAVHDADPAIMFRGTPEGWAANASAAQIRALIPKLRAAGHTALAGDMTEILPGKRGKNPLPDPANLIASAVIQSAARFVTDKVLRGGENPDGVQIMERAENPRGKKGGALYTDHKGLAFRIHAVGRDMWRAIGAEGLGSAVGGVILAHIEKRGDGLYYVGIPAVGQWWKPTGKNLRAAANYVLSVSDEILSHPAIRRGSAERVAGIAPDVSAARARKRAGNPAGSVLEARYEVEPYRVWINTRTGARQSVFGAAPLWPDNERELITDGYTIHDTFTGTRGAGRKPFATLAEAETFAAMANQRDAEYKALAKAARAAYDKANMPMVKTGKGRGRAKPKGPAGAILLVLVGHPGGLGYYTGKAWDTEKRKAIRFDSVAGATATAQLLAGKIPQGTKMEVRKV